MDDAHIQFFRTGKFPADWEGVDDEYYRLLDDNTGFIEFNKTDDFYIFLKSAFAKYDVNLDAVKTIDELSQIEREYYYVIEGTMIERRKKKKPRNLDEAYSYALAIHDNSEASRLLRLIFERDRRGILIL